MHILVVIKPDQGQANACPYLLQSIGTERAILIHVYYYAFGIQFNDLWHYVNAYNSNRVLTYKHRRPLTR